MQHEGLFSKAKAGTKQIVEEYHDTVCEALNFICDEGNKSLFIIY